MISGSGAERGAQGGAFFGDGHEEAAGAGGVERLGDAVGPEAVAIGLDHGGGFAGGQRIQLLPVGDERVEGRLSGSR